MTAAQAAADEEHAWFHAWLAHVLPARSRWHTRHAAKCKNPACMVRRGQPVEQKEQTQCEDS
jgi:hypothetical protein